MVAADALGMIKHFAVLKNRCFVAAAICLLAVSVCFVPVASATGTPDQTFFPANTGYYNVDSTQFIAQTFTAGLTGNLTDVSVLVWTNGGTPAAPITVQILAMSGGVPQTGSVIGSGSIPASSVSSSVQQVTTTLSVPAPVVSGQQYALELSTAATFSAFYEWGFVAGGYSGGNSYWIQGASNLPEDQDFATYVSTATPASSSPRAAYCTVAGNTSDDGAPLAPGSFLNLDEGQASSDSHYAGATPALFVQGEGLTCGPVPAGYVQQGYATADMNVDANTYPYYAAP